MLQSLETIRDPVETDQRRTISIVSPSVRQVSKLLTKRPKSGSRVARGSRRNVTRRSGARRIFRPWHSRPGILIQITARMQTGMGRNRMPPAC